MLSARNRSQKNLKKAIKWYTKSAEQGNSCAQSNLGCFYESGYFGVKKDLKKAIQWYKKASAQGFASAQDALGELYYKGEGVQQDYKKSIEWYKKPRNKDMRQPNIL